MLEKSRAWVKERLTAFICKETNWWISRWIQCNVFFCPKCRGEYKSLKRVWDKLDEWPMDAPSPDSELKFSQRFREEFPSAFRTEEFIQPADPPSWAPRFAFALGLAAALLTVVVLDPMSMNTEDSPESGGQDPRIVDSRHTSTLPEDVSPAPLFPSRKNLRDIVSRSSEEIIAGVEVIPTSYGGATQQAPLRSSRHMVEINNFPVTSFESLTSAPDEQPY